MITEAIVSLRKDYMAHFNLESIAEINRGYCIDFAHDIEEMVEGDVHAVSEDEFKVDVEENPYEWDEEMLREYRSFPPGVSLSTLQHEPTGYHFFLYYKGKFYDAECENGVRNLFNLPFYKRYLDRITKSQKG